MQLALKVSSIEERLTPIPAPVILRFSHGQASHVTVEANPLMFRVGILDLSRLEQRRRKVNLQEVFF